MRRVLSGSGVAVELRTYIEWKVHKFQIHFGFVEETPFYYYNLIAELANCLSDALLCQMPIVFLFISAKRKTGTKPDHS